MKSWIIIISFCLIPGWLFAQQTRLVDCPIELAEDVILWDKLINEKLKILYPNKVMFENCSSLMFEQVIQKVGIQLVDVRTKAEYDEDHIPGAILIDVRGDDFDAQITKLLYPERPVAVY